MIMETEPIIVSRKNHSIIIKKLIESNGADLENNIGDEPLDDFTLGHELQIYAS